MYTAINGIQFQAEKQQERPVKGTVTSTYKTPWYNSSMLTFSKSWETTGIGEKERNAQPIDQTDFCALHWDKKVLISYKPSTLPSGQAGSHDAW